MCIFPANYFSQSPMTVDTAKGEIFTGWDFKSKVCFVFKLFEAVRRKRESIRLVRAIPKYYGLLERFRMGFGIERKALEVVIEEERWKVNLAQPLDPPL